MNISYFKTLLQQNLSELKETAITAEEAAQTVELDQSKVGRLSRMDAMQQQAMSQEQNRRRTNQIKRIHAALARIENEEYGYCLSCDEEINEKRLQIDPATPFCIKCANQQQ